MALVETSKMDFGEAIEALKEGRCVQRRGWNGKDMHLYLEEYFEYILKGGVFGGQTRKYDPVICMYTAQGTHQPGWLASQADMLAEDWQIVEPELRTMP